MRGPARHHRAPAAAQTPNQALIETLQKDCEALENETLFASADRYMALIYPEFTTAASYLPQEAIVAFCDHGNLQRGEKGSCGGVRPSARFVFDLRYALWRAVRLLRHDGRSGRVTARSGCYLLRQLPCRAVPGVPAAQAAAFLRPGSCRAMAEVWKQRRLT